MSKFDALREEYKSWADRQIEYERISTQFFLAFVNGFREYIGAPDTYTDHDGSTKWYIEPQAAKQEEGQWQFRECEFSKDLLERDEDGYWTAGLRITVNPFPIMFFVSLIRFLLVDNRCKLLVGFQSKEFTFDITSSEAATSAYDYILDLMRMVFNAPPSQIPSLKETTPIGFVWPKTDRRNQ